jgi:hypothetical protein
MQDQVVERTVCIITDSVDDFGRTRPGNQQGIGFVEPQHTLMEMKQSKAERCQEHDAQQSHRASVVDLQDSGSVFQGV